MQLGLAVGKLLGLHESPKLVRLFSNLTCADVLLTIQQGPGSQLLDLSINTERIKTTSHERA